MTSPRCSRTWERHKLIGSDRQRRRAGILSLAEMLLIMVLLDTSPYKTFKAFWFHGLQKQKEYRPYFNELPSYERFVALMPRLLLPSYLLVHWFSGTPIMDKDVWVRRQHLGRDAPSEDK